jgi:hypothetical protein
MRDFRGGNRFAEQESLDLHASISICFPSRLKAVARTGLSPKNGRAQRARGRGIDLGGAGKTPAEIAQILMLTKRTIDFPCRQYAHQARRRHPQPKWRSKPRAGS